jgi:8-oxo-dGTP diphosphatase
MAIGRHPKSPFSASAFLYDSAAQSLLLHLRDGNTSNHPNSWAFFGGSGEPGETDVDCCLRELREEIGLILQPDDLVRLREYPAADSSGHHIAFYVEKAVPLEEMVLGEGAGFAWVPLSEVMGLPMNPQHRDDIRQFAASRGLSEHLGACWQA